MRKMNRTYFMVSTGCSTSQPRLDMTMVYAKLYGTGPQYLPYPWWMRAC